MLISVSGPSINHRSDWPRKEPPFGRARQTRRSPEWSISKRVSACSHARNLIMPVLVFFPVLDTFSSFGLIWHRWAWSRIGSRCLAVQTSINVTGDRCPVADHRFSSFTFHVITLKKYRQLIPRSTTPVRIMRDLKPLAPNRSSWILLKYGSTNGDFSQSPFSRNTVPNSTPHKA